MGWSGLWLIALRAGETPNEAIARGMLATMEENDEGMAIVANPEVEDTEPSTDTDEWIADMVQLLTSANASLQIVEDQRNQSGHRRWVVLTEDDGPVVATVYLDSVQLQIADGYVDPDGEDGAGFDTLWRYCQIISASVPCAGHDPDYDQLLDLRLPPEAARQLYR